MSSAEKSYPRPVADMINQAYIDTWRDGRLMIQYCPACESFVFFPRPHCPRCWSSELQWRDAAGRGRIVSFSLVHRPNHEAFFDEVPIVLAEVMLEEQVPMLARIACGDAQQVRSGRGVALLPPERGAAFPLPTFELLDSEKTA